MPGAKTPDSVRSNRKKSRTISSATLSDKVRSTQSVVQRTVLAAQRYKSVDVMSATELAATTHKLETVFQALEAVKNPDPGMKKRAASEQALNVLQEATSSLSSVFKSHGTESLSDLLAVCFGSAFEGKAMRVPPHEERYAIMCKHCRPTGYKVVDWKSRRNTAKNTTAIVPSQIKKNRIVEDFMIAETASCLDCFDLARTTKAFHTKVYGVKFAVRDPDTRKTLVVSALVDDVPLSCLSSPYVKHRISALSAGSSASSSGDEAGCPATFKRFVKSLTLKDLLVYNEGELSERYVASVTQAMLLKQRTIAQSTRDFLTADLYGQRTTLMNLLVKADEHEFQYLAYLLYDLLSCESSSSADAREQALLLDSLPASVRTAFHEAMRQTVRYTTSLTTYDSARIPLEQQICLLKASDAVKEKAMLKLKEVKAKSEDSGSKARQYLEGLLRIPFGCYRKEPALGVMSACAARFGEMLRSLEASGCPAERCGPDGALTSLQIREMCGSLEREYPAASGSRMRCMIAELLQGAKRARILEIVEVINAKTKAAGLKGARIPVSGKTAAYLRAKTDEVLKAVAADPSALWSIGAGLGVCSSPDPPAALALRGAREARKSLATVSRFMEGARAKLDESVHGHDEAKKQLERIIGQWVNGDQTGYCFGFEGPPGVGKTSLAKHGVASCLQDGSGNSRPFAFVAIGGSSNGSTLEGHNYTYVGSTWGRIVDVLMEKKCMNPIIFIDELDKVSKTEHGRELIGILTHLVDPTQNDAFQDKYFNGVDIDLSRALFVFSYNDPSAIDRVLLDRIHRIKFTHLSMEDKLTVARRFLLPELYSKMGLEGVVDIPDEVVEHIIDTYTSEAGVRKLKELLFEIVGEINLGVLRHADDQATSLPIVVTMEDVARRYLKTRRAVLRPEVVPGATVGVITGLWANQAGLGGVLPVEVRWCPGEKPLALKLTGMQGDVMKESMAVAGTVVCDLVKSAPSIAQARDSGHKGIHIHVPEGATPKDGPSAGAAITAALYSLLTGKPIHNHVAVTGEICLRGKVTAIGGLDLKIAGGVRSGVTRFMYPAENQPDMDEIMSRESMAAVVEKATFTPVSCIEDVLAIAVEGYAEAQ